MSAGIGDRSLAVLELEHLDAGLGWVACPFVMEGAGHLALQAASAFFRIDDQ